MINKIKEKFKSINKGKKIKKTGLHLILAVVLLFVALIQVPSMLDTKSLKGLGYSTIQIKEIRKQNLKNPILKNKYYSINLASSIETKTLKKEYLELYVVTESLKEKDFLLYDRLIEKGYKKEVIVTLFDKLKFYEITPLLVFDYQSSITPYIEDALANSSTNSEDNFTLSNTYGGFYTNIENTKNEGNYDMLVNKQYTLSSSYTPATLSDINVRYASSGVQLDAGAADGLKDLCEVTRELGLVIYASGGFRSYDKQKEAYDRYLEAYGEEEADKLSSRAGHSEHQTGLTVDLAAGGESKDIASFEETPEFTWLIENAANHGWILRYPKGKEAITGYDYEPWHFRYVGTDLAQKVFNSKLTYDEYYMLYLLPQEQAKEETK
ncbi:MAG: M15 family metallopeptidase [Anaerorhabdus sp.]